MLAHSPMGTRRPGHYDDDRTIAVIRRAVHITLSGLLLAAPIPLISFAATRSTITMGNADNQIVVQAGDTAPRVLRLTRSGVEDWIGAGDARLIDTAFVDGKTVALHWRFDPHHSRTGKNQASLVYVTRNPDLRLRWTWRARSPHGPVEHTILIENCSVYEIEIPLQDSLDFEWKTDVRQQLQQLWIAKGAGEAPPVGTHLVPVPDGYDWRGRSSTFAHPRAGPPREIIPYFLVRATGAKTGGWYAGVEFSGRIAMTLQRHDGELTGTVGLDPQPGPFRTRIAPHATFATPTIFVGASDGDLDDTGNTLRRWVRTVLNDPATLRDPHYPLVTNNSWGSATAIDEKQAKRMIDDASALGFEMFHLDAGWFRAVGDWRADPRKFPHGIAALADDAHQRGMKFGLWAAWSEAGDSAARGALSVADPRVHDWLTTDPPPNWKADAFKGITIDLAAPAAKAWAARETDRLVRDYHVDMLEHDGYVVAQGCDRDDHPHLPNDPAKTRRYRDDDFLWVDSSNSTDVSLHATRAYYAIQSELKRRHPGLLREICNDGGRMVDFGSAAHGDYFSIVDAYDPVSNRKAFYDASHVLPPAMLETYVMAVPAPRIENFRYMLRSGMLGWFTAMIDTSTWTREQHEAAAREIAFYKSTLRPLIREADLYHIDSRPDGKGWDGMEYFDDRRGAGVLYAFHGNDAEPGSYAFRLKGLRAGDRYKLHFRDGTSPDRTASGTELMHDGLTVSLPLADSSELVTIERVR